MSGWTVATARTSSSTPAGSASTRKSSDAAPGPGDSLPKCWAVERNGGGWSFIGVSRDHEMLSARPEVVIHLVMIELTVASQPRGDCSAAVQPAGLRAASSAQWMLGWELDTFLRHHGIARVTAKAVIDEGRQFGWTEQVHGLSKTPWCGPSRGAMAPLLGECSQGDMPWVSLPRPLAGTTSAAAGLPASARCLHLRLAYLVRRRH